MTELIDRDDVYHLLRTILNELPPGTATLERDPERGRSQLISTRKEAAGLYGIGNIEDCKIGIVEVTHSHFDNWTEAIEFCREVVRGDIEYTVWRDGDDRIVRAQSAISPYSTALGSSMSWRLSLESCGPSFAKKSCGSSRILRHHRNPSVRLSFTSPFVCEVP